MIILRTENICDLLEMTKIKVNNRVDSVSQQFFNATKCVKKDELKNVLKYILAFLFAFNLFL